jgi:hypothetical protein
MDPCPGYRFIAQQSSENLMIGTGSGATSFGFSLGEWDVTTLAAANAVVHQTRYLTNFSWKAAVAVGWFELGTVFLVTVVHFALPFGESLLVYHEGDNSAALTSSPLLSSTSLEVLWSHPTASREEHLEIQRPHVTACFSLCIPRPPTFSDCSLYSHKHSLPLRFLFSLLPF